MAYHEYFSGTATRVNKEKFSVTEGKLSSPNLINSSIGKITTKVETHWEFKIGEQIFQYKGEDFIEEGDKVAVAARNKNNGYYNVTILRNYTKNYRKPSTIYVIGTAIGLCLALLVLSLVLAIPIGKLVGSFDNAYFVLAIGSVLFTSYLAIGALRAIKTLQNMPPPLIHNIMRLFWGNAPKSAICL